MPNTKKKKVKKISRKESLINRIRKKIEHTENLSYSIARYVPLIFGALWLLVGIIQEFTMDATLLGFIFSSFPGLIIISSSVIALKDDLIGGIILNIIGIAGIILIFSAEFTYPSKILMVTTLCLPLLIPAILLIQNRFFKKKK
ncbi:MAG: hypothetical protein ACLFUO_01860 [Candidatus Woesearchaeota archaeon]